MISSAEGNGFLLTLQDIRTLDKEMRAWDTFSGLDSMVKNMVTSLRAVGELQNPAIRDRHWEQLMQATQVGGGEGGREGGREGGKGGRGGGRGGKEGGGGEGRGEGRRGGGGGEGGGREGGSEGGWGGGREGTSERERETEREGSPPPPQVKFLMSEDTNLADLLALNLHNFEDEVRNIVDKASKEQGMEKTLREFEQTWSQMEFEQDTHPRTKVELLQSSEELIETLEDNQVRPEEGRRGRGDLWQAHTLTWGTLEPGLIQLLCTLPPSFPPSLPPSLLPSLPPLFLPLSLPPSSLPLSPPFLPPSFPP